MSAPQGAGMQGLQGAAGAEHAQEVVLGVQLLGQLLGGVARGPTPVLWQGIHHPAPMKSSVLVTGHIYVLAG